MLSVSKKIVSLHQNIYKSMSYNFGTFLTPFLKNRLQGVENQYFTKLFLFPLVPRSKKKPTC